ncbi:unnamed protein product, partial [Choristocarpus tenellus]
MTRRKDRPKDDFLEIYYDVVVLSTGLSSSVVAAALAKAGKTVLHLDRHGHYGDECASFSFNQLLEWAGSVTEEVDEAGDVGIKELCLDLEAIKADIALGYATNELKKQQELESEEQHQQERLIDGDGAQRVDREGNDEKGEDEGLGIETVPVQEGLQEQSCEGGGEEKGQGHEMGDEEGKGIVYEWKEHAVGEQGNTGEENFENDLGVEKVECQSDKQNEEARERKRRLDEATASYFSAFDNACLMELSPDPADVKVTGISNDCAQELKDQYGTNSSETGASGLVTTSYRRHPPSHPSWYGRRHACKLDRDTQESKREEEADSIHPAFHGYRIETSATRADLVQLSRSFSLDLTSQVILASGLGVDALVDSGVSRYLEFKDIEALFLASELKNGPGKGAPCPAGQAQVPGTLKVHRVPCSKADVFRTKMLTPLEKRKLMKFLQFASDRGVLRAGEDVFSRNERGLGQGRSLRRPQNREAAYDYYGYDLGG